MKSIKKSFALGFAAICALSMGSVGCVAGDEQGTVEEAAELGQARQPAGDRSKAMGIHEYTLTNEGNTFVLELFGENGAPAGRIEASKVDGVLWVELSRDGELHRFKHTARETHVESGGESLDIAFDAAGEAVVQPDHAPMLARVQPAMELAVAVIAEAGLADQLTTATADPANATVQCYTRISSSFGKSAPCASIQTQASWDCILGFAYKGSCNCSCNFLNWCSCSMDYCCW